MDFHSGQLIPPLTMLISYFRLQDDVKAIKGERPAPPASPCLKPAPAGYFFFTPGTSNGFRQASPFSQAFNVPEKF
jgi:hypothetical protein